MDLPSSQTPQPPPTPEKHPRRRPRSPITSPLPSLRLLLHPRPGLGIDLLLPLSQRTRCYMQLESLFNGPSMIRIGLHPRNHPGVRVQLSPTPRLSVRVPLRLAGAKYIHVGISADALWGLPQWHPEWPPGAPKGWRLAPFVEFWRYTTVGGLMDRRMKKRLKEYVGARKSASGLDGRGLDGVPTDPRDRDELTEMMKSFLEERNRVRHRKLESRTRMDEGGQAGRVDVRDEMK